MLHDFDPARSSTGTGEWPANAEEAATQMRAVLEMLARLAAGVGMPQTSEMLLYAADVADDEARLTPTGPLRQN